MDIVDLELGFRREAESYAVDLRFLGPGSDAETRKSTKLPIKQFDIKGLEQKNFDDIDIDSYATLLTEHLFASPELKAALAEARAIADSGNAALRFRLLVDRSAPELHRLYWESLRDPSNGASLFTGERVLFSRYLTSDDWRSVQRRPKAELRALVVIANPTDLESYHLAALDVPAELARAKAGLEGIADAELASGGTATLDNVIAKLRDGRDVLYLVCHGAMIEGKSWLWLEEESGKSQRVEGDEFIRRVEELQTPPALVVLASCQSAGAGSEGRTSDAGILAALGPGLAKVGVPAILAMQGDVTMTTVAKFMPVFFRELQRNGQIDRAVAAARGAVRERDDWYVPVLFMRLKGGCLWYAGLEIEKPTNNWKAVTLRVRSGDLTAVLGPGLTDPLLGPRHEMARRWAETYRFPMDPNDREALPQVAQFLAIKENPNFPMDTLVSYLLADLTERYHEQLSDDSSLPKQFEPPTVKLNKLISTIGKKRREQNPNDAFQVLAECPIPIFVTTLANDLMADALREVGKQPRVEFCRWAKSLRDLPSFYDETPRFRPTVEEPLVFHFLGTFEYPESIVLTEDQHFEFLTGIMKEDARIPNVVRSALAGKSLLLLGFSFDDWDFRVTFQAIRSLEGGEGSWASNMHISAQVEPDVRRVLEPQGAHEYVQKYFSSADIGLYWGSAEEFARELAERLHSKTP